MKLASLAILLCLTSATLCAPTSTGQPFPLFGQEAPAEAKIVLAAPSTARVGELVRLDVSESVADSYEWLLVPATCKDFEVYAEGRKAVFSARTPGEYRFIVAAAKGATVDVVTIVIHVDTPPNTPTSNSLAEWIPYWNWDTRLDSRTCEQIAISFEAVLESKDELTTAEEWIKATAESNRAVLGDQLDVCKPLLAKIGAALMKKAESGALTTPEEHEKAWLEVVAGLRRC